MPVLTLSLGEIIVLMLGAIVLGITIHFFITSRRNLKASLSPAREKSSQNLNEWKSRYFNDIEVRDKELTLLRKQLLEAEENLNIYSIEAEEMRKDNKRLQAELETARKSIPPGQGEKPAYVEELRSAQVSLQAHNEKINKLLEQIDVIKETEEKQQAILRDNEELYNQIEDLQAMLAQKEQEINASQQNASISKEMTSMLDNAYLEFNALQDKIIKLETQLNSSGKLSMEYEDLKEDYYKVSQDYEQQKIKLAASILEARELRSSLEETEDSLKEANFQRQQLQKRVHHLEELNNDLQAMTEANKRLEGQIRRIGELESMLNVVAEE
ncbi:MAG TPA: hypothetical protein VFO70_01730, partial [Chitinophagaceae bacterium]|nr:hypothetical protein [Chitinophagaceae bacterium]